MFHKIDKRIYTQKHASWNHFLHGTVTTRVYLHNNILGSHLTLWHCITAIYLIEHPFLLTKDLSNLCTESVFDERWLFYVAWLFSFLSFRQVNSNDWWHELFGQVSKVFWGKQQPDQTSPVKRYLSGYHLRHPLVFFRGAFYWNTQKWIC